jgi:hypothetical protein
MRPWRGIGDGDHQGLLEGLIISSYHALQKKPAKCGSKCGSTIVYKENG